MAFRCQVCGKAYEHLRSLRKHETKHHAKSGPDGPIKCFKCPSSFFKINQLIDHAKSVHELSVETVKFEKETWKGFMEWKDEEEEKTRSNYVQFTGSKIVNGQSTYYFYCRRSGDSNLKSTEERRVALKSQKSCKIGTYCTAHIIAVLTSSGKVEISFTKTHFNHQIELKHHLRSILHINKIKRLMVGGMSPRQVYIELIRKKEIQMLTMKEITNIQARFGINQEERLANDDLESLRLHLDKDMKSDFHSYTYKPIGSTCSALPGLSSTDFFLVLMTEFQVGTVTRCLNGQFKLVCLDATHLTNKYGYKLITLLVIDEFHEGIAGAFCIANRETELVVKEFLKVVKVKCPAAEKAKYLMSDDDPVYFAAWSSVFGPRCTKLLCAWHIDRAWKEKLKGVPFETRKEVYKLLKAVHHELDKDRFEKLKNLLYNKLMASPVTKSFGAYLDKNYLGRSQYWAYCFRTSANLNQNMNLESFNKRFKFSFMMGRPARRLDFLIKCLLEYLMVIEYEVGIRQEKGKSSKMLRRSTIQGHKKGLEMDEEEYDLMRLEIEEELCEGVLEIYEITNLKNSKSYRLINTSIEQGHQCRFHCDDCKVCICKVSCTCIRYAIHTELCKHIHFLCLNQQIQFDCDGLFETAEENETPIADLSEFDQIASDSGNPGANKTPITDSSELDRTAFDSASPGENEPADSPEVAFCMEDLRRNKEKIIQILDGFDFGENSPAANQILNGAIGQLESLSPKPLVDWDISRKRKKTNQVRREPTKKAKTKANGKSKLLTKPTFREITNFYDEANISVRTI